MSEVWNVEVLIVGGGHAGLLLGAALSHGGITVRLVERQPEATIMAAPGDGRSLAVVARRPAVLRRVGALPDLAPHAGARQRGEGRGSAAILRRVGAWPHLAPHAEPVERVEVVDVEGGGQVRYDSEQHGKGPFGVGVEHASLRRALLEAFLAQAGEDAYRQGEVASLKRVGGAMGGAFSDGSRRAGALVGRPDGRAPPVGDLGRVGVD